MKIRNLQNTYTYSIVIFFYSYDDNNDSNLNVIYNITSIDDVTVDGDSDFDANNNIIVEVKNSDVKETSAEFPQEEQLIGLQLPQLMTKENLSLLKNVVNGSLILINAYQRYTYSIFTTYN